MILSLLFHSARLRRVLVIVFLFVSITSNSRVREVRNAPSPEVANLGTFGSIPVDLYTGTPNISVPLYTMSVENLSIPIELSSTCPTEHKKADGKIEYVYVYAGTNSKEDVAEDILQTVGLAPQYSWAVSNARKLSSELKNVELTFVGHSLGGGEAAAASMATGRKAITFNRASVSKLTKEFLKLNKGEKNIENYQMSSDPLTLIQNKLSVGAKGKNTIIETEDNFAHGIDNFLK